MRKTSLLILLAHIFTLAASFVTPAIVVSASTAAPTNYYAYWDFNEDLLDKSGNNWTASLRNSHISRVDGIGYNNSGGLRVTTDTENDSQMNATGLGHKIKTHSAITFSGWYKRIGPLSKERFFFNVPRADGAVGIAASLLTNGKIQLGVRNATNTSNVSFSTASTTLCGVGEKNYFHCYNYSINIAVNLCIGICGSSARLYSRMGF